MLKRAKANWLMVLAVVWPSVLSVAAPLPDQFKLMDYVPGDCWLAIEGVHNADGAWVEAKWGEVFAEFQKQGIAGDVLKLIGGLMDEQARAHMDQVLASLKELGAAHDWSAMFKRDVLFAERLDKSGFSYILLSRADETMAPKNAAALVALVDLFSKMASAPPMTAGESGKTKTWELKFSDADEPDEAFSVTVLQGGEVAGIVVDMSFGKAIAGEPKPTGAQDIIALINAGGKGKNLTSNPRFTGAIGQLPAPDSAILYFDIKSIVGFGKDMFAIAKKESEKGEQSAEDKKGMAAIDKLLGDVDFMDYIAISVSFKGRRETSRTIATLQEGKENGPIVKAFSNRKPFEKFDQYIPVDATSFSLSGFIDFEGLWDYAMNFIAKEVPEGEMAVNQINGGMMMVGFDIKRDLFSWWSGEMISVSLPATNPSPMGGGESVLMIRVKDAALASTKVNAGLTSLSGLMTQFGQSPLMITPSTAVEGGTFSTVAHPMMMMMQMPPLAVGVAGDYLFLASSEAAVNKCLAVAAGKAPSITESPRFKAEGLAPKGPVASVSFTDLSTLGKDIASGIQGIAMAAGFAVASIPESDPESKKAKQAITQGLGILMKMGPVVQKIDFFSSSATMTVSKSPTVEVSETLTTYKAAEAAAPAAPATPATPAAPKAP